jgi:hypothetical protein
MPSCSSVGPPSAHSSVEPAERSDRARTLGKHVRRRGPSPHGFRHGRRRSRPDALALEARKRAATAIIDRTGGTLVTATFPPRIRPTWTPKRSCCSRRGCGDAPAGRIPRLAAHCWTVPRQLVRPAYYRSAQRRPRAIGGAVPPTWVVTCRTSGSPATALSAATGPGTAPRRAPGRLRWRT